jgi:hypothetical protein
MGIEQWSSLEDIAWGSFTIHIPHGARHFHVIVEKR